MLGTGARKGTILECIIKKVEGVYLVVHKDETCHTTHEEEDYEVRTLSRDQLKSFSMNYSLYIENKVSSIKVEKQIN